MPRFKVTPRSILCKAYGYALTFPMKFPIEEIIPRILQEKTVDYIVYVSEVYRTGQPHVHLHVEYKEPIYKSRQQFMDDIGVLPYLQVVGETLDDRRRLWTYYTKSGDVTVTSNDMRRELEMTMEVEEQIQAGTEAVQQPTEFDNNTIKYSAIWAKNRPRERQPVPYVVRAARPPQPQPLTVNNFFLKDPNTNKD